MTATKSAMRGICEIEATTNDIVDQAYFVWCKTLSEEVLIVLKQAPAAASDCAHLASTRCKRSTVVTGGPQDPGSLPSLTTVMTRRIPGRPQGIRMI